jgi:hypothetical protein
MLTRFFALATFPSTIARAKPRRLLKDVAAGITTAFGLYSGRDGIEFISTNYTRFCDHSAISITLRRLEINRR